MAALGLNRELAGKSGNFKENPSEVEAREVAIFMKYEQGCIFGSIQFYQFEFLGKRVTPKKRALPGLIHFSKQ